MRTIWRLLLLGALAAALGLPAASLGKAAESHVLQVGQSFTTADDYGKANPLVATVSGVISRNDGTGRICTYDAFYAFGPCFTKPVTGSYLYLGFETSSFVPQRADGVPRDSKTYITPPYSASHNYTFTTDCSFNSEGCGRVKFSVGPPGVPPDKAATGSLTITVGGSVPTSVLVRFNAQVSGIPNVPIRGAKPSPHGALVKSVLRGSGTATFTKEVKGSGGKVIEATKTTGAVLLDNTYADGTKEHFEFGVISRPSFVNASIGTAYAPQSRRLLLLLNVTRGGTSDCPQGKLTLATLTLLPGPSGFDGPGNSAIFAGIPNSYDSGLPGISTDACKGHAYGWVTQGSADPARRVTVRVAVRVPR
jgi:hypothetical protein